MGILNNIQNQNLNEFVIKVITAVSMLGESPYSSLYTLLGVVLIL